MAGEDKGDWANPRKIFRSSHLSSKEKALCDTEMALQKGRFCSLAEKGRILDPQDPLVARLSELFKQWNCELLVGDLGIWLYCACTIKDLEKHCVAPPPLKLGFSNLKCFSSNLSPFLLARSLFAVP